MGAMGFDEWAETTGAKPRRQGRPLRTLLFDIETSPMLSYIWGLRNQDYIPFGQVVHDSFMLCWSAQWRGEKKLISGCLTPTEVLAQVDQRIVVDLADLIREADVVVAHNGRGFDIKMLKNRLLLLGLDDIGPVTVLDTLTLARKNFRLASNRLGYLGEQLGVGTKHATGGFQLWRDCYLGDEKALAKMLRYNRQDVVLLGKVLERMLPYLQGVPRLMDGDGSDLDGGCPWCGGEVKKDGFYRTNASTFQKVKCSQCGKESRWHTAIAGKKQRLRPL